jgi:hypothetical protein
MAPHDTVHFAYCERLRPREEASHTEGRKIPYARCPLLGNHQGSGGPGNATPTPEDELFRLLVESVRDYAIFLLDPTGHVVTWNEGARRPLLS